MPRPPWLAIGAATAVCVLFAGWASWRRRRWRRKELKPPKRDQSSPEPLLQEVTGEVDTRGCPSVDSDEEIVEEVLSRAELARRRNAKHE
eukprot:COSAG05_NODE_5_length_47078_cov_547.868814_4_plen_90_part_00